MSSIKSRSFKYFQNYKSLSKTFKYRDKKVGRYLRIASEKQRESLTKCVLDKIPE